MLETEKRVIDIIAKELKLNPRKITPDTILSELGDSLDLIRIVLALEEEYDLEIVDEDVEAFFCVGDIAEYIARLEENRVN